MNGPEMQQESMTMVNLDCPWCGAAASLVPANTPASRSVASDEAAEMHCPDCAITVALAPDPRVRVALAA
jgi:predicted RNA-binding Zn-ribbon protein involved in translation (DUF1610 family)